VDWASIVVRLVAFVLKFALELHADLDRLKGVGCRHGPAGCDASGYEGADKAYVSLEI